MGWFSSKTPEEIKANELYTEIYKILEEIDNSYYDKTAFTNTPAKLDRIIENLHSVLRENYESVIDTPAFRDLMGWKKSSFLKMIERRMTRILITNPSYASKLYKYLQVLSIIVDLDRIKSDCMFFINNNLGGKKYNNKDEVKNKIKGIINELKELNKNYVFSGNPVKMDREILGLNDETSEPNENTNAQNGGRKSRKNRNKKRKNKSRRGRR